MNVDGGSTKSVRVQIAVDAWTARGCWRTGAPPSPSTLEHRAYGGTVEDQLAKNWYTAEVGDVKALRGLLGSLRNVDSVFDAYRVTPS